MSERVLVGVYVTPIGVRTSQRDPDHLNGQSAGSLADLDGGLSCALAEPSAHPSGAATHAPFSPWLSFAQAHRWPGSAFTRRPAHMAAESPTRWSSPKLATWAAETHETASASRGWADALKHACRS